MEDKPGRLDENVHGLFAELNRFQAPFSSTVFIRICKDEQPDMSVTLDIRLKRANKVYHEGVCFSVPFVSFRLACCVSNVNVNTFSPAFICFISVKDIHN